MAISAAAFILILALQATRYPCVNGYVVDTDPTADLQMGTRGELACRVEKGIYVVNWYKLNEEQVRQDIIYLDLFFNVGEKGGPGYEKGTHDITDNLTLVIKDVHIESQGRYICEVADILSDRYVNNFTNVSVLSSPQEPFPQIEECLKVSQDKSNNSCIIIDSLSTMTCFVDRYYPDITLAFFNGIRYMNSAQTNISVNPDKTLCKVITMTVTPSEEPYTCVASDIPGQTGNQSTHMLVSRPVSTQRNILTIILPVSVVFGLCVIFAVVSYIKRRKQQIGTANGVAESSADVHYDQVNETTSISRNKFQMKEELEKKCAEIEELECELHDRQQELEEHKNKLKEKERNEKENIDEINRLRKKIEELEGEIKLNDINIELLKHERLEIVNQGQHEPIVSQTQSMHTMKNISNHVHAGYVNDIN